MVVQALLKLTAWTAASAIGALGFGRRFGQPGNGQWSAFQQLARQQFHAFQRQPVEVFFRPLLGLSIPGTLQVIGLKGNQISDKDDGLVKRAAGGADISRANRQMIDVGMKYGASY